MNNPVTPEIPGSGDQPSSAQSASGDTKFPYDVRELCSNRSEVIARDPSIIIPEICDLEMGVEHAQRYLHQEERAEAMAKRYMNWSRNIILIGLLLTPIGVGIPILIAGALAQHSSIKHIRDSRDTQEVLSADIGRFTDRILYAYEELFIATAIRCCPD